MKILNIVGTTDADECAALRELVAIWRRGGWYTDALLDRIPDKRVNVHVQAAVGAERAVFVIEDGVVTFQRPRIGRSVTWRLREVGVSVS
jgi:hypothetical protein